MGLIQDVADALILNMEDLKGNPVELRYDKLIDKFNGRIVGIYKNHIRLVTGEICDKKIYEVLCKK